MPSSATGIPGPRVGGPVSAASAPVLLAAVAQPPQWSSTISRAAAAGNWRRASE
ncbi:MAG: hypothetical protein JO184_03440 [Gammaproteobacteria bacterium]|nr:hypothetical protein [Gammaproteobacteria bacterium]